MSATPTRFVVLATPRTGSNWLCTLLDAHPEVLCHHELFNPKGVQVALRLRDTDHGLGDPGARDADPLGFLARVWAAAGPHRAVGFKLNLGQDARVFDAVLADGALPKLLTLRRNRVRTYVSELVALASGHWESYRDRSARGEVAPVRVDPAALLAHAARNAAHQARLREAARASGAPLVEVAYEDLRAGAPLDPVFAALGLAPAPRPTREATFKRTPDDLKQVIENFDELAEALAGTPLSGELHAPAA